jgi:filamentous hemagglutinin
VAAPGSQSRVEIDDKIRAQLAPRGWTETEIREAVSAPPIGTSTDHTIGKADAATVYGSRDHGYVVVNDETKRVVQISDKVDPGWVPDSRIIWK